MAVSLRRVRDRVRVQIKDMDSRKPIFAGFEVDQAIAEKYLLFQGSLPAAEVQSNSAFTISAGGDTFTLPSTVTQWTGNDGQAEYAGQFRIQLVSTGFFLRERTGQQMDSLRQGVVSSNLPLGVPDVFTLWEDKTQTIQGRCYPGAESAEACNLFTSLSADDLRDFVGTGSDDLDDVKLQLSRLGVAALVSLVSADLLERMLPEQRKLDVRIVSAWRQAGEIGMYQEAARHHDIDTVGTTERWVY